MRIGSSRRIRTRVRERNGTSRTRISGPLYCDASALLKLYLPEPDSEQFNDMVARRTDLLVSDLGVTEIVSALARRAREGAISRSTLERARRAVIQGLDNGLYRRVELTRDVHRRAEHLLVHLTDQLRAADALHLALATSAGALSMASFDRRLAGAARAVGLEIYPEPR